MTPRTLNRLRNAAEALADAQTEMRRARAGLSKDPGASRVAGRIADLIDNAAPAARGLVEAGEQRLLARMETKKR